MNPDDEDGVYMSVEAIFIFHVQFGNRNSLNPDASLLFISPDLGPAVCYRSVIGHGDGVWCLCGQNCAFQL